MDREIKFRSWVDNGDEFTAMEYFSLYERVRQYCSDSYEVMQYTGLKDGDDVECWDGDIVEFIQMNSDMSETKSTAFIQWGSWCYSLWKMYKGERNHFTRFDAICAGKCKVIGNIHQNPELL